MPDEDVAVGQNAQLETQSTESPIETQDTASAPESTNAGPSMDWLIEQNAQYQREIEELRAQRNVPTRDDRRETTQDPARAEEDAANRAWEDRMRRILDERLKPVDEFVQTSRQDREAAAAERQTTNILQHADSLCAHMAKTLPIVKGDDELAKEIQETIERDIRALRANSPNVPITLQMIRDRYNELAQVEMRRVARYQARQLKAGKDRAPGQAVTSLKSGGAIPASGGKEKDVDYENNDDVELGVKFLRDNYGI